MLSNAIDYLDTEFPGVVVTPLLISVEDNVTSKVDGDAPYQTKMWLCPFELEAVAVVLYPLWSTTDR